MKLFSYIFSRSLAGQSSLMAIGGFVGGFFSYAFHIIVSRFLSVSEYGELQALLAVLGVCLVPTQALLLYVTRRVTQHDSLGEPLSLVLERIKRYVYVSIAVATLFYSLLIPVLILLLHLTDIFALLVVVVTSGIGLLGAFYQGIHLANQRFALVSMSGVLNAVLKFGFALFCVYFFGTIFSLIVGIMIATIITLWYLICRMPRVPTIIPFKQFLADKRGIIRTLYTQSRQILVLTALLAALAAVDVLLAKHLLSSHDAGVFSAYAVVGKIIFWITNAVVLAVFPRVSKETDHNNIPNRSHSIGISYMIIGGWGLAVLSTMAFYGQPIISILFGMPYLSATANFWVFGLEALFLSFIVLEAHIAYARNDRHIQWLLAAIFVTIIITCSIQSISTILSIITTISIVLGIGYGLCIFLRIWKFYGICHKK